MPIYRYTLMWESEDQVGQIVNGDGSQAIPAVLLLRLLLHAGKTDGKKHPYVPHLALQKQQQNVHDINTNSPIAHAASYSMQSVSD